MWWLWWSMRASPVECSQCVENMLCRRRCFWGRFSARQGQGLGTALCGSCEPPQAPSEPWARGSAVAHTALPCFRAGLRSVWAPSSSTLQGQGSLVGNQREEFPSGVAGCQEQLQNSTSLKKKIATIINKSRYSLSWQRWVQPSLPVQGTGEPGCRLKPDLAGVRRRDGLA